MKKQPDWLKEGERSQSLHFQGMNLSILEVLFKRGALSQSLHFQGMNLSANLLNLLKNNTLERRMTTRQFNLHL